MLGFDAASKSFGAQVILDDQTWALPQRGVVGLVGVNGAGKTTLLRIFTGENALDSGRLVRPKHATVGYLPQELGHSDRDGILIDTILTGRPELLDMEGRLEAMAETMSTETESAEYADLQHDFEQAGGYRFRSTAREIAAGLGFEHDDYQRPIQEFSGGWQMRALLARLLLSSPNLLLMDEPTNHLDMGSVEWLEGYLGRYPGCVVLVSHDRYFLNRMVTQITELDQGKLRNYVGNYDQYTVRKAEDYTRLVATAERQKREIDRIEKFVERFRYKATKAKQAQSRLKALNKIERIEVEQGSRNAMEFRFPQPPRLGRIVVEMRDLCFGYGEDPNLYHNLNFTFGRQERVALVGPNGAGKSTLLKLMAGKLQARSGELRLGNNVRVSYFAQHALDELNPDATIYDEVLSAATQDNSGRVRDVMGAFGFSGDDAKKPIRVLSGGEKNRAALAKLMMNPGGLLLLDEPTNHLDIPSRQVLESALMDFDGAVITVSHDRYFINQIATHTIHVEGGGLTTYIGDYNYYLWKREQDRAANAPSAPLEADPNSRKAKRQAAAELRARSRAATKDLTQHIKKLEAEVEELEQLQAALMVELADPTIYQNPNVAAEKNRALKATESRIEDAMMEWETVSGELETKLAEIGREDSTR